MECLWKSSKMLLRAHDAQSFFFFNMYNSNLLDDNRNKIYKGTIFQLIPVDLVLWDRIKNSSC